MVKEYLRTLLGGLNVIAPFIIGKFLSVACSDCVDKPLL